MEVRRPIRVRIDRFMADPASIRNAAWLIIGVTLLAMFAGSLVIWLFDKRDYESYGDALWYSLQTVTTVGYGDVTPTTALGRVVGGVVMVVAIGFITIVTAAVTSLFVEAAHRKRREAERAQSATEGERLDAALAAITERLDRIEQSLARDAPDVVAGRDAD
jgi:voltage-gated potassium channel